MPIRASSIRGNLRFWWRATRSSECSDFKSLLEKEGKIWGNTKNPSKVVINTEITLQENRRSCSYLLSKKIGNELKDNQLKYFLFPFQENKKEEKPESDCIPNISFRLTISYPVEYTLDIESAIWAWTNFGGVGSRTRRGCGSLFCNDFAPDNPENVSEWYNLKIREYQIKPTYNHKWSEVPKEFILKKKNYDNSLQAWNELAILFNKFRQGEGVGRNKGQARNRPGRSLWPEPETLRRIYNKRERKNSRMEYIPDDAFPRAEFGLPIIFRFKDRNDPQENIEVKPIYGNEEKRRMASPLILKPLKCTDGNIIPIIMKLNSPKPDEIWVKGKEMSNIKISEPELSEYNNSPLRGINKEKKRSDSGSAVEAFMSYAKENGFIEGQR